MSIETSISSAPRPATATLPVQIARRYLGSWRGLLALGVLALVLGITIKWRWLVAAGIAPLLIGALPCIAMCALGLCMSKAANGRCGAHAPSPDGSSGASAAQCQSPQRSPENMTDAPARL